jgi:nucleoside-diphosphate-sugar epimerase
VVIHAATAIPTGRAATRPSAWALNDRIRTDGTLALATAAGLVGATRYLQQSLAWVVERSPGGAPFDESTPPSPPRLLASAVEGEAVAREVGGRYGFDVAVLRNGVFYAPDSAHTLEMADNLRRRRPTVLGGGKYLVAPIHADDAARAFALAADARGDGLWHIVDDEPVEAIRFHRHFADLLDAPPPRRVPLWLARLAAGKDAVAAVTTSMHTSNARARAELGWVPTYPTHREGLRAVVEAWAAAAS